MNSHLEGIERRARIHYFFSRRPKIRRGRESSRQHNICTERNRASEERILWTLTSFFFFFLHLAPLSSPPEYMPNTRRRRRSTKHAPRLFPIPIHACKMYFQSQCVSAYLAEEEKRKRMRRKDVGLVSSSFAPVVSLLISFNYFSGGGL